MSELQIQFFLVLCIFDLFVQNRWALAKYVIPNHSAKYVVLRNKNDAKMPNLAIGLL